MKITFLGAGSTVFAKNVLGDCIVTPELGEFHISLHDIDPQRLEDSRMILENINKSMNGKATISAHLDRKESLVGANYVVNAIQVGGYDPCTITDFEVPKKYGLRQTIADSMGIGGIFRSLRTIPVLADFAKDIEEVCPDAIFLNYTNPMSSLTGFMLKHTNVKTIGLCHSVQVAVPHLLKTLKMEEYTDNCVWEVGGINHQNWLIKLEDLKGNDLYPEVKRRAADPNGGYEKDWDLVRLDMMQRFGYYITESSEHNAEYSNWYIKKNYPELIEKYKIPLDEYITRCKTQIAGWEALREEILADTEQKHELSPEYGSYIIKAAETDKPIKIYGNVLNTGLIPNLPSSAVVEVPCVIDRNGVTPCYVGEIPEQCAAINRISIGVQNLTVMAATELKKEYIYMAAMLDPHTSAELSPDDIKALCDDMIEAHDGWLPKYR